MREMLLLRLFKEGQQSSRLQRVVLCLLQFGDKLLLASDMTLTERDVLLGLRKVLL